MIRFNIILGWSCGLISKKALLHFMLCRIADNIMKECVVLESDYLRSDYGSIVAI